MTAEKLLEKTTTISKALFDDDKTRDDFMKNTESWKKTGYFGNGKNIYLNDALQALAEIICSAREEIDKASAKSAGKSSSRISALKSFAKCAVNMNLKNGLYEYQGKWVLLDGHRVVRLNADVSSLPHMSEDMKPYNIEHLFKPEYTVEAVLPTVAELKAFIAEMGKERKPIIFEANGVQHGFNPKYLLELQQILPNAKHYFPESNTCRDCLYSVSEDGEDALTLPVNIGK